ncbi:MAG: outer membrane beta-barrel protein [Hyphomicrobium sp.]
MKSWILGIAAVGLLATPAFSAGPAVDRAAPAVGPQSTFKWTGGYVGANAGYAWGRSDPSSQFSCTSTTATCPWNTQGNFAAFAGGASGSASDNGFTGGAQTGYNLQIGGVIYGIEADFNAFQLKSSVGRSANMPGSTVLFYTSGASASTDWLATIRGRFGLTVAPNALVYLTGGLALTDLETANRYSDNASVIGGGRPNISGASSSSSIKAGFALGAGLELALDSKWTFRAEYLHVDFSSAETRLTTNGAPLQALPNPNAMATSADLRADILRVGINYKLF